MPKIKEYQQQVGTSSGLSGAQVSLDVAGQVGRAITGFGQAVGEVEDRIRQRNETVETTSASAKMAELRAKYTNKIKEDADNGSVDYESIQQEYDNDIQNMSNEFDTDVARNYIARSGAETKSSISINAFAAQSELTRVKVLEDHQRKNSADSQTLRLDPTQYDSIKSNREEYYASLNMGAKQIEKLRHEDARSLNLSRISGEIARTRDEFLPDLQKAIEAGKYNLENLNSDDVSSVISEIRRESAARESDKNRKERLNNDAKDKAEDAMITKYLADSASGENKYSRLDIIKTVDPQKAMSVINFLDSFGKRLDKTNSKSLLNEAYKKLLLPEGDPNKIYSFDQLRTYTEKMDANEANWLVGRFNASKSPEEKAFSKMKSTFYDAAKKNLGIDPLTKIIDPRAEEILASLTNEFETEFAKKRAEGISPSEMLTREGKHSLYPMIDRYRRSLNEKLSDLTKNLKSGKQSGRPKKEDGKEYSADEWMSLSDDEKKKARARK